MRFLAKPGCMCLPAQSFTCKRCAERNAEKPEVFTLESEPVNFLSKACQLTGLPDLTGYGYRRADQDGFDGGEVSPAEHKEEEFFEAANQLLQTK